MNVCKCRHSPDRHMHCNMHCTPLLPTLALRCRFYGFGFTREAQWRGELAAALGEDFERVQLVWLLANTRHELTCMAVKRAAPAAGGAAAAAAEEPETAAAAAQ